MSDDFVKIMLFVLFNLGMVTLHRIAFQFEPILTLVTTILHTIALRYWLKKWF